MKNRIATLTPFLLVILLSCTSCHNDNIMKTFENTAEKVHSGMFKNDTNWKKDTYRSTLNRAYVIDNTTVNTLDSVVELFCSNYTLIYNGTREKICEIYNNWENSDYIEKSSPLFQVPYHVISYATDFNNVAILKTNTEIPYYILIGRGSKMIVIYEPYSESNETGKM